MRPVIKLFATSLILALCAVAFPAAAQDIDSASVRDAGNGDYTYEFYDDPLAAGNFAPRGGNITVVNRSIRTLLIRPRAQFVTEMLKSVENL